MAKRVGRGAAAVVAAAALSACGEPRTTAEYEWLRDVHLAAGAATGLVLMGLVLAFRAWRRRGRDERLALGPPSDAAVVAAYSSLAAIAALVALGGALVASVLLPEDPAVVARRGYADVNGGRHVFAVATLALFVIPVLAALAALFADWVEYPPRGPGAVPVALLHALLAFVVLEAGSHEAGTAELVLRCLLAAPVLAGTVAYLALHVGWWRSAVAVPRRRT